MDTELVWFEDSNWEHQKDATHIVFHFKIKTPSVIKVVKEYMESIGMKAKNFDDLSIEQTFFGVRIHKSSPYIGMCVDMVNKEFWPLSRYEVNGLASQPGYYIGYPSQVLHFINSNTGRLTGKKFGL
jgi:hypothetical protein